MASVLSSASLDGGAVILNQLISANHRDGSQMVAESSGGRIDPDLIGISTFEPVTSIVSTDILTLLLLNGSQFLRSGFCPDNLNVIPLNTREDCASLTGFSGISSHVAIQGMHGLLVPMSIEAGAKNATATCNLEMHWISDDGNPTPVPSTGNALTTGTFIASFVCGPAYINGDRVTQLQSWTVNTGITVEVQRDSGRPYPEMVFITKREPTIDLMFENEQQAVLALNSLNFSSGFGGAGVYLRRRQDKALYVDSNIASHISLGFLEGITRLESLSANATQNNTFTIRLHGKQLSSSIGVVIP